MIAHSLRGTIFGPAQALHGTTFVVDLTFLSETLGPDGIVVDIGRAHEVLKSVLSALNYKNLDDLPEFAQSNSTTEVLAQRIHERIAESARAGQLGRDGRELAAIRVTLSESHVARAWYEAPV